MAICLHEYLSNNASNSKIQIFATDISEKAIAKARAGQYLKKELAGVSEARLHQCFTKINGHYQVKKAIRDMCVFATHNFLKDPPFAKIDLISCRNVLIYLEPFLQKKAFSIFHYALNEKGYLLLGKSETTGSSSELFYAQDKKRKLYSRKSAPGRFMNVASERRENDIRDNVYAVRSAERKKDDFQKNADDILLSKYTPAGVIVNEQFDIVQFRGSTGDFLEPSPGKASLNVLKMAREGLSFELRNALHKSKTTKEPFIKESISINYGKKLIAIEVIPLLNTEDLHFLILFRDSGQSVIGDQRSQITDHRSATSNSNQGKDTRIEQLEKKLAQALEDMRSITEEQEAANEELQSANEELLSSSEELQSLNEELETSKEEIESTNEELTTTNDELQTSNNLLNESYEYSKAIIDTMHEPMLVLDKSLRVKSASRSFYEKFEVKEEETEEVFLFDLGNKQWNIPRLQELLKSVVSKDARFEGFEITHTFPKLGERTMLLNASRIKEMYQKQLILLSIVDSTETNAKAMALQAHEKKTLEEQINAEKNVRKQIETSEKRYNMMVMQSPFGFALLKGKDMVVTLANDSMKEMWGKGKDIEGKPLIEVIPEIKGQGFPELLDEVYTTGKSHFAMNH